MVRDPGFTGNESGSYTESTRSFVISRFARRSKGLGTLWLQLTSPYWTIWPVLDVSLFHFSQRAERVAMPLGHLISALLIVKLFLCQYGRISHEEERTSSRDRIHIAPRVSVPAWGSPRDRPRIARAEPSPVWLVNPQHRALLGAPLHPPPPPLPLPCQSKGCSLDILRAPGKSQEGFRDISPKLRPISFRTYSHRQKFSLESRPYPKKTKFDKEYTLKDIRYG